MYEPHWFYHLMAINIMYFLLITTPDISGSIISNINPTSLVFKWFKSPVEKCFNRPIFELYTNNNGEYMALKNFVMTHGISHLITPSQTLEQNGFFEHRHGLIIEIGLTLLHQTSLPPSFWPFAFATAIYLIIVCLNETHLWNHPLNVSFKPLLISLNFTCSIAFVIPGCILTHLTSWSLAPVLVSFLDTSPLKVFSYVMTAHFKKNISLVMKCLLNLSFFFNYSLTSGGVDFCKGSSNLSPYDATMRRTVLGRLLPIPSPLPITTIPTPVIPLSPTLRDLPHSPSSIPHITSRLLVPPLLQTNTMFLPMSHLFHLYSSYGNPIQEQHPQTQS